MATGCVLRGNREVPAVRRHEAGPADLTAHLKEKGDKASYEKDVRSFVDLAYKDLPRIPVFQPYSNVAMQKNVSGYAYWFHRRLDYRTFAKG